MKRQASIAWPQIQRTACGIRNMIYITTAIQTLDRPLREIHQALCDIKRAMVDLLPKPAGVLEDAYNGLPDRREETAVRSLPRGKNF